MQIKPEDCQSIPYNPFSVKPGMFIWDAYKPLQYRDEFQTVPDIPGYEHWGKGELSDLLAFVIIFVDDQSPLYGLTDFEARKKYAYKLLEIDEDDPIYREIEEHTELFNDFLFGYFKLIHNTKYESWFSAKMNFHHLNKLMRMPLKSDSDASAINARKNLQLDIKGIGEDLMLQEAVLFKDPKLASILKQRATQDNRLGGYPEKHALTPEWKKRN